MKKFIKSILIIVLFLFLAVFFKQTYAIELSVEAPQEMLMRDQVFDWKVNIDTQGESIQKQEFYFTYEKDYLKMEAFMAGDFFDNVSFAEVEPGKLYVEGKSNSPKSGSGMVALARMKIIADSPGTANLCAATLIQSTPTPQNPTATIIPTRSVLTPSALPTSGVVGNAWAFSFFGIIFLALAVLIRFI